MEVGAMPSTLDPGLEMQVAEISERHISLSIDLLRD